MSKIGIGIITVQNRKINPNIYNWISGPTQFYVFVDKDRMGCSYGRNECIKHLYDAGCDYIFLFDDDTYPTMKGWEEKIIDWAFTNKVNLLAMVDQKHDKIIRTVNDNNRNDTVVYDGGFAGPFVFLTRKAIETIGYYNTEYKDYSWEDVSYCYRAKLAGLCGAKDGMYTPVWLSIYIHDEDVFNENPIPSFPADYKQKKVEENQPIAQCECLNANEGKLYYDYEEQQRYKEKEVANRGNAC